MGFFADLCHVTVEDLAEVCYHHDNRRAVRHLMGVASGLDSMVLGENQIVAQIKEAYTQAQSSGTCGPVLHRVVQSTLATAKKVRNETGIGDGRQSVASVAVDFARHLFQSFEDKTVLAVGAGKMIELALQHFLELKPGRVRVTNRSPERAERLAGRFDAEAVGFDRLADLLVEADFFLSCTGSTEPLLNTEWLKPLIRKRRFRPLFLIDIAVPRDVEPAVGHLPNVYLYDIDDLQRAVADEAVARNGQVPAAEAILEPAAALCYGQIQQSDHGRLVEQLRNRLKDIGDSETRRTLNRLRDADPDRAEQLLAEHTHRLINKILHKPLSGLRDEPSGSEAALVAAALRRLFDLDETARDRPSDRT